MGKKSRQMLSYGNYEIIEREDFDTEQETYLIEPMPAPKLDATRDLDLGKVRWEDEVICKLMMWIYKTEREKQIKKPKSLKLKYRFTDKIAHRTKYYLLRLRSVERVFRLTSLWNLMTRSCRCHLTGSEFEADWSARGP